MAESGALESLQAFIEANLCVGNPRSAAAIEIAYGRFALKADRPVTLAPSRCASAGGDRYRRAGAGSKAPFYQAVALDAGERVDDA